MKFEEQKIILKNGKECILAPTTAELSEQMIEYMKVTAEETKFLLRYPDEITFTLEGERELLTRIYENDRQIMMVGLVDGVVAGNCSINPIAGMRRLSHRCSLAIALRKEYWGLGLGTAMMKRLCELAKEAGYERVELGVIEGNDTAKHLYEVSGFTVDGRIPMAMKYDDGTYLDEILMSKSLR